MWRRPTRWPRRYVQVCFSCLCRGRSCQMKAERSSQRDNWCKAAPKETSVQEDGYRTDGMLHGIVMTSDTIKAHAWTSKRPRIDAHCQASCLKVAWPPNGLGTMFPQLSKDRSKPKNYMLGWACRGTSSQTLLLGSKRMATNAAEPYLSGT